MKFFGGEWESVDEIEGRGGHVCMMLVISWINLIIIMQHKWFSLGWG